MRLWAGTSKNFIEDIVRNQIGEKLSRIEYGMEKVIMKDLTPIFLRVYDLKSMLIPFTKDKKIVIKTQKAIKKLFERKVFPIFEELGIKDNSEISLDLILNDRRELDKIIMEDMLGLNIKEQLDVYRAVADLVKSRIDKAQSFGKKGKIEEGIDIDAIKKIVIKKIKEEEE